MRDADAIVAPGATVATEPHLAEREIEVVIHRENVSRIQPIETTELGDRFAARVHEGLRLGEDHAARLDLTRAELRIMPTPADADPPAFGKGVDDHESEIVPRQAVAGARIPETDDQPHDLRHRRDPER
jgi:hypothetical protein